MNIEQKAMKQILEDPAVVAKMKDYISKNTGWKPASDPVTLAGQTVLAMNHLRKRFFEDVKRLFPAKQNFDSYLNTASFLEDSETAIREYEKQNGFHSFDDETTMHFSGFKKLIKKVGSGVKDIVTYKPPSGSFADVLFTPGTSRKKAMSNKNFATIDKGLTGAVTVLGGAVAGSAIKKGTEGKLIGASDENSELANKLQVPEEFLKVDKAVNLSEESTKQLNLNPGNINLGQIISSVSPTAEVVRETIKNVGTPIAQEIVARAEGVDNIKKIAGEIEIKNLAIKALSSGVPQQAISDLLTTGLTKEALNNSIERLIAVYSPEVAKTGGKVPEPLSSGHILLALVALGIIIYAVKS